ncbi:T9SS type A sorting domain-containing protein [Formosa maritima]|uniref:T9SS type A sorting domain-containing protein n=1 Tax=Formosa maritima TaxID=2592046 RepID=A0A5D0G4U4_9FLAO|nr:T9SS type A sorting domain-containing protein [Formosa maritima]TYA53875.1 T9SS type A sorting domain-containing protein [Formosa maritima]
MKNYYLLLVLCISIFSINNLQAQFCPPIGFSNSDSLFFFYDSGTIPCGNRPQTIQVDGSEFTLMECENTYSIYDLTSGSPISNINSFTADFGIGTCEYTNGNLTQETLSINQVDQVLNSTRVFPNPLLSGNNLHLVFDSYIQGKGNIFNITGKKVLSFEIDNLSRKQLDVSSLSNGVYLMQLDAGASTITKKVIIMK